MSAKNNIIVQPGTKVWKRSPGQVKQPNPFKSGLKVNTVRGIVDHPILHVPAYTFEEDDSCVEIRRCYPYTSFESKYYRYRKLDTGKSEWVCLNELDDSEVELWFAEMGIAEYTRVSNPPAKWLRRERNVIDEIIEKLQGRKQFYSDELKRLEEEGNESTI